jgi:hypothetical protein
MRSEKRSRYVLAVLCLGSLAGAVHAEEALRTSAAAAFPDVKATKAVTVNTPPQIVEGEDLNRAFGARRPARNAAARADDLLANPYGMAENQTVSTLGRSRREIEGDERWSNPYATARLDDRWDNPYGGARPALDERWDNPYSAR